MEELTPMFISGRAKQANAKYEFFQVVNGKGEQISFDVKLINAHDIDDNGILTIHLAGNQVSVYKVWAELDYKYNNPN